MSLNRCEIGDCRTILRTLDAGIFRTCVTSPPYWGLRDYGVDGQLGLEPTPDEYVAAMVDVFREVRRVLADDGTLWLNLGDSYASNGGHADTACNERRGAYNIGNRPEHDRRDFRCRGAGAVKPKDLVGIPWMVAFALRADGWYLRSDIIWAKPNPMPESVTDRPTKAHEYLFLLSKRASYYYDADAIAETAVKVDAQRSYHRADNPKYDGIPHERWKDQFDGRTWGEAGKRNRRSVWTIPSEPYPGSHFATFPTALVTPCILAGSALGDAVLDPFMGSGTVAEVAEREGRRWFGCELNPAYAELIKKRTAQMGLAWA